jgi:hypothetical protein
MNRIIIQPSRRATPHQIQEITERQNLEEARDAPTGPRLISELSKLPKTLFDLWIEYVTGIGGRKPAKDFTPAERGRFKCTYCRRRVFWDMVTKHVNSGFTSAVAIDRIYQCYGRKLPVTKILIQMVKDKKAGGHPNLQL